jgi:rhodanese-related sulfurtransferase
MNRQNTIEFTNRTPNTNFEGVEDVTSDELNEKRNQVTIIDVRRPEEWSGEFGHIPGAKLVPLENLPDKLEDHTKDEVIVFVCRSGNRSARATAFAQANGYSMVYNLFGGMISWTAKNFETTDRNGA